MAKTDSPIKPPKGSSATPRPRRRTAVTRGQEASPRPEATDTLAVDASSGAPRADSTSSEPSEEAIRLRAYHRYLARGGGHGLAFDDWLEAERELKGRK